MTPLTRISLVLLALAISPGAALAQKDYPNKPIRAIASQGPGGLSDVLLAQLRAKYGNQSPTVWSVAIECDEPLCVPAEWYEVARAFFG